MEIWKLPNYADKLKILYLSPKRENSKMIKYTSVITDNAMVIDNTATAIAANATVIADNATTVTNDSANVMQCYTQSEPESQVTQFLEVEDNSKKGLLVTMAT